MVGERVSTDTQVCFPTPKYSIVYFSLAPKVSVQD